MEKRDCFGSIRQITLNNGQTLTHSRPECRTCEEIRDCLRTSKQIEVEKKEKDELRKQNLISQIIDLSHITSNEIGSCLLEFLSRIYSSHFGMVLFKNLLLFHEIPRNSLSFNLTVPISRTVLDLMRGEKNEQDVFPHPQTAHQQGKLQEGFPLRIILFQRSFPNRPKANMGLIAYEVARAFVLDNLGVKQIFQTLSDVEIKLFERMDTAHRMDWLIEKWGFKEEFEALKNETAR
jgi:hypothetical protein